MPRRPMLHRLHVTHELIILGGGPIGIEMAQAHRRLGCEVTVLPATATAEDVLALNPEGVFLSNGPGDPAATGEYAVPVIKALLDADVPLFGICLGHQMLALAAGAMLFVVSHEIIPETHRNGFETMATGTLLAGFVFMLLLDATLS